MFEIIWPEYRSVSEDKIRVWYADAVANGETECPGLTDAEDMARELSNIGHITLGRRPISSSIFRTHSCWKCDDGRKPCVAGYPRQCEYPHARNE